MGEPHKERSGAEPVLISMIEHYSYCPRQCGLIHLEQTFDENIYTLRGKALHEHVHADSSLLQKGIRTETALPLWSERLGLVGKADLVEFHGDTPYPVEYKHGRRRKKKHDDLQLCAQAICLEEMTGQPVDKGAIYHHSSRRRREVIFTAELRREVESVVTDIRQMLESRLLPHPADDKRCPNCSLFSSCVPGPVAGRNRVRVAHEMLFNDGVSDQESEP